MAELKRKRKPSKVKVIVTKPFNATGKQRGKGEQELSNEEYEFALAHNCLRNGA